MFERRSLRWPITVAVVMIVLLIALAVGWVLLNVAGAYTNVERATVYWILLSAGSTIFVCILLGIVFYLWLSIQQISLNRRQSNFIDSVTHELKSPIASLKLYLQTLNRRQVTEAQRADFYQSMLADVDRLDQLINHLLDTARLERPKVPTENELIGLPNVIQHAVQAACQRYNVPTDCVTLQVEPLETLGSLPDFNMLIGNIIDNAVKYSSSPPQIDIQLEQIPNKKWCRLKVIDNGPGIPRHFRRKVFGRFFRVGSELERSKPGTGLGLFIVYTLVRRLGGRIQIQDAPAGPGTQIVVQLPISTPAAVSSAKAIPQNAAASPKPSVTPE
jgi:two-component system, OmpR family, phosphate regulon sensor histidine kinase PhoR